jgi:hypothetical protein
MITSLAPQASSANLNLCGHLSPSRQQRPIRYTERLA